MADPMSQPERLTLAAMAVPATPHSSARTPIRIAHLLRTSEYGYRSAQSKRKTSASPARALTTVAAALNATTRFTR